VSSPAARWRGRRLEWIGTIVVLAVATWYWLLYFNRATNLLDEGSTAAQALRIVNGDLIYRDFFTVVTPGSYYTVAWLFRIFGEHLMVLRWAALVTGIGLALATLVVTRRLTAWPFAAAAALMTTVWGWFLVTPNYYSLEAALLSMVALGCYLRAIAGADRRWVFAAGAVAGLTVMVKQNVGAYTFAALFIALWASQIFELNLNVRARVRASVVYLAGFAAPIVATLWWLIASGAGPYLYESWVYYPLTRYPERFARPYPEFSPLLPPDATIPALILGNVPEVARYEALTKLVLYLPVLVYPVALAALVVLAYRSRRNAHAALEGHVLLAVTLTGLLTLLQAWPRADVPHILFGLPGTFVVFGYVLFLPWRAAMTLPVKKQVMAPIALAVTLAPAAWLLWNGYSRTDWEYQNYFAAVRTARATGIFTGSLEAQRIDVVTNYITEHTTADDFVFVVPWASGFNFLTDRANPTRTDFMLFEDPESYPCLRSRLDARPPKYVIYGYTWDVDDKRFRDYAAPIDQYIRSRYAIEFTTDGYEIWKRLDGAAEAVGSFPKACQPRRFRFSDWRR
jgi:4-amino-4-deoxy-L-arabinose transferase-like glycosyltransferase